MRMCPNCNAENPDDAHYCHMCGIRLRSKIQETLKDNGVFIFGLFGIGVVFVGVGLLGTSFGIGATAIMLGIIMIVLAFNIEKSK